MRILFIGDYSNLHTTLAQELKALGHEVHVLSDGCGHMKVPTDIYLKREKGFFNSFRYLFDIFSLLPRLKDYDVVQMINTNFLSLKPTKIKYFYDRLKEQNRSMFLTLAGNDYYYVKACYDAKIFRYSEFKVGNEFTPGHKANPGHMYGWISNINKHWAEYLLNDITGAVAVLPEYVMPVNDLLGEKLAFSNLPINFSQLPAPQSFMDDKVNILVGMRSGYEEMKGSKILYKIAKELEEEHPDKVKLHLAKDLPFNDFINLLSKSDIVLDQLYGYSPAMTALYAMSMGKLVGTGGQPEYYEAIGNPEEQPLLSLTPFDTDIKERLVKLINNREEIIRRGKASRKIALENNDSKVVAQRFLNHWEKLLKK